MIGAVMVDKCTLSLLCNVNAKQENYYEEKNSFYSRYCSIKGPMTMTESRIKVWMSMKKGYKDF